MKKILITSGGTREYIDDVRVLTNVSSGKLGAKIAERFSQNVPMLTGEEYQIHYVAPKEAVFPTGHPYNSISNTKYIIHHVVTDVQSVYDIMKELVPQMEVVIHCMAVSDFGFKPCETKLKSNDPEAFIESMRERIYQTPKILKEIKVWNPKCKLISFKFEVGLSNMKLIGIALKSMVDNNCDLVIANDKSEMTREKEHIAYAVTTMEVVPIRGKENISEYIYNFCK